MTVFLKFLHKNTQTNQKLFGIAENSLYLLKENTNIIYSKILLIIGNSSIVTHILSCFRVTEVIKSARNTQVLDKHRLVQCRFIMKLIREKKYSQSGLLSV